MQSKSQKFSSTDKKEDKDVEERDSDLSEDSIEEEEGMNSVENIVFDQVSDELTYSQEEIDQLTLTEDLTLLEKGIQLMKKGNPTQIQSVYNNLEQYLQDPDANKQLIPLVFTHVTTPSQPQNLNESESGDYNSRTNTFKYELIEQNILQFIRIFQAKDGDSKTKSLVNSKNSLNFIQVVLQQILLQDSMPQKPQLKTQYQLQVEQKQKSPSVNILSMKEKYKMYMNGERTSSGPMSSYTQSLQYQLQLTMATTAKHKATNKQFEVYMWVDLFESVLANIDSLQDLQKLFQDQNIASLLSISQPSKRRIKGGYLQIQIFIQVLKIKKLQTDKNQDLQSLLDSYSQSFECKILRSTIQLFQDNNWSIRKLCTDNLELICHEMPVGLVKKFLHSEIMELMEDEEVMVRSQCFIQIFNFIHNDQEALKKFPHSFIEQLLKEHLIELLESALKDEDNILKLVKHLGQVVYCLHQHYFELFQSHKQTFQQFYQCLVQTKASNTSLLNDALFNLPCFQMVFQSEMDSSQIFKQILVHSLSQLDSTSIDHTEIKVGKKSELQIPQQAKKYKKSSSKSSVPSNLITSKKQRIQERSRRQFLPNIILNQNGSNIVESQEQEDSGAQQKYNSAAINQFSNGKNRNLSDNDSSDESEGKQHIKSNHISYNQSPVQGIYQKKNNSSSNCTQPLVNNSEKVSSSQAQAQNLLKSVLGEMFTTKHLSKKYNPSIETSTAAECETDTSMFDSPFDIKQKIKENKVELPSEYQQETMVILCHSMPEVLKTMFQRSSEQLPPMSFQKSRLEELQTNQQPIGVPNNKQTHPYRIYSAQSPTKISKKQQELSTQISRNKEIEQRNSIMFDENDDLDQKTVVNENTQMAFTSMDTQDNRLMQTTSDHQQSAFVSTQKQAMGQVLLCMLKNPELKPFLISKLSECLQHLGELSREQQDEYIEVIKESLETAIENKIKWRQTQTVIVEIGKLPYDIIDGSKISQAFFKPLFRILLDNTQNSSVQQDAAKAIATILSNNYNQVEKFKIIKKINKHLANAKSYFQRLHYLSIIEHLLKNDLISFKFFLKNLWDKFSNFYQSKQQVIKAKYLTISVFIIDKMLVKGNEDCKNIKNFYIQVLEFLKKEQEQAISQHVNYFDLALDQLQTESNFQTKAKIQKQSELDLRDIKQIEKDQSLHIYDDFYDLDHLIQNNFFHQDTLKLLKEAKILKKPQRQGTSKLRQFNKGSFNNIKRPTPTLIALSGQSTHGGPSNLIGASSQMGSSNLTTTTATSTSCSHVIPVGSGGNTSTSHSQLKSGRSVSIQGPTSYNRPSTQINVQNHQQQNQAQMVYNQVASYQAQQQNNTDQTYTPHQSQVYYEKKLKKRNSLINSQMHMRHQNSNVSSQGSQNATNPQASRYQSSGNHSQNQSETLQYPNIHQITKKAGRHSTTQNGSQSRDTFTPSLYKQYGSNKSSQQQQSTLHTKTPGLPPSNFQQNKKLKQRFSSINEVQGKHQSGQFNLTQLQHQNISPPGTALKYHHKSVLTNGQGLHTSDVTSVNPFLPASNTTVGSYNQVLDSQPKKTQSQMGKYSLEKQNTGTYQSHSAQTSKFRGSINTNASQQQQSSSNVYTMHGEVLRDINNSNTVGQKSSQQQMGRNQTQHFYEHKQIQFAQSDNSNDPKIKIKIAGNGTQQYSSSRDVNNASQKFKSVVIPSNQNQNSSSITSSKKRKDSSSLFSKQQQ